MSDLKLAAQAAIFAALNVPAVTDLAPVHEFVPETEPPTQPPLVIINDMNAKPAGGKGGEFDRIEFEIITLVREPGREFLTPLMAAVRDQLEGQALASAEAVLSAPVFESDDDQLLDDGQTYSGAQRFSLFAQPAD